MEKFQNIVEKLDTIKISNEKLCSVIELREKLMMVVDNEIEIDECILTPYCIDNGKMYELYEYEWSIEFVNEKAFNQYLLRRTGRKRIEDVPVSIVKLHKKCHVELLKEKPILEKSIIEDYLDFLLNSFEVKEKMIEIFKKFTKESLYFILY